MQRPNILVITTDQQRWDALGAAGNEEIQTPNLDRLAGEGVMFSNCFVQSPVCMPSRASFLSGQYPESIGITHMGVPLPEQIRLLPSYVKNYGYRTANIGKLHALPHANRDHREPHPSYGFDHLEISDEPGPYEDAYRAWVRARAPEHLDAISVGLPPSTTVWQQTMGIVDGIVHPAKRFPKRAIPFPAPAELTHSAFVANQTRSFIDQQGPGPWLCVAGFYSPHSPWVAPQSYIDLYDPDSLTLPPAIARQPFSSTGNKDSEDLAGGDDELRSAIHGYYAMISEVDHHVGTIMDHLREKGLMDQTLLVFTSDHGEWLGKYGRYGKGHPADDAISRVPLLIRAPSGFEITPHVVPTIVEALDVLPTLLEGAHIPIPNALQGTSLWRLMRNQESDHPEVAITEHHGWKTLRTSTYRYVVEASGREYLFHLETDPHERRDVSADPAHADALSGIRHQLLQRIVTRERPRARTWTY